MNRPAPATQPQPSDPWKRRLQELGHMHRLLQHLFGSARRHGLAPPDEHVAQAARDLAQDPCRILVAGEMKRGKSSLVNGLVGRPLLPVDMEVATCQVFKLRAAPEPALHVELEDGSRTEISESDLEKYGSQTQRDLQSMRQLGGMIRWVDCAVPCSLLPPGVALLDSPGIGSMHSAHAQVTERFLPRADGVLFVLDALTPVKAEELEFLERIVEVCPHVLFIMTKIDMVDRDTWTAMQARHETILQQRFGGRVEGPIRVWPISSSMLTASHEDSPDAGLYRKASRFPELRAELHAFLVRASRRRALGLLELAAAYHQRAHQMMAGRVDAVSEAERALAVADESRGLLHQLQQEWGPHGPAFKRLAGRIRRTTTIAKQAFRDCMVAGGAIELDLMREVDAIADVESGRKLAERLDDVIVSQVARQWRETTEQCGRQCLEGMHEFAELASRPALEPSEDRREPLQVDLPGGKDVNPLEFISMAARESYVVNVLGGVGVAALQLAGVALGVTVSGGLLFVVGLTVALGGFGFGCLRAKERQLEKTKTQLQQRIKQVLQQLHRAYFDVDLTCNEFSLVDEHFQSFEHRLLDHVQQTAARRAAEIERELERLKKLEEMPADARRELAQKLQEHLKQWEALGAKLVAAAGIDGADRDTGERDAETPDAEADAA